MSTLQTFPDIEQGTDEWLDIRRGLLTASVIGQFITPKTIKVAANEKTRAMAYQLVAERITGHTEDRYVSREMEAGHYIEPIARNLYSETFEPATEVGFMVREDNTYRIGYSPDGTVGTDGLIEIKLHLPKLHLEIILANEIPSIHIAQCQTGLFVSGRKWIDYISFCGGMPLFVKRMYPDPTWQSAILEAITEFEKSATTMRAAYDLAVVGMPMTERVDMYEEIRF
jgi:YqaJ-like viral recombinase domain